jgi:hypothetical protein
MWKMILIVLVTAFSVLAADAIHKMTLPDTRVGAVETAPRLGDRGLGSSWS